MKRLLMAAVMVMLAAAAFATDANVTNAPYSAVPNDTGDDTSAIQAAVDAVGTSGGTVTVPAGTYFVDNTVAVHLTNGMTFSMLSGAVLQAMTNTTDLTRVLYIKSATNVTVTGGTIKGDRGGHSLPQIGGYYYGMGIWIDGANNVTLSNVTASEFFGDGFFIANSLVSSNIVMTGCTADHNQRQGLSIESVIGVLVTNCTFSRTEGATNGPEYGIDIEPYNSLIARDITIVNCLFSNNAGGGIIAAPMGSAATISNVLITGNTVISNGWSLGSSSPNGGIVMRVNNGTASFNRLDNNTTLGMYSYSSMGTNYWLTNRVTRSLHGTHAGGEYGSGLIAYNLTNFVAQGNILTNNANYGLVVVEPYSLVITNGNVQSGNGVGDGGVVAQNDPVTVTNSTLTATTVNVVNLRIGQ